MVEAKTCPDPKQKTPQQAIWQMWNKICSKVLSEEWETWPNIKSPLKDNMEIIPDQSASEVLQERLQWDERVF